MSIGIASLNHDFLSGIHKVEYQTPNMYFYNNPMIRWYFWERLNVIVKYINSNYSMMKGGGLDFERGSVFLSTLLLMPIPSKSSTLFSIKEWKLLG